jgi:phosphoribosyl 1,2-cyclic phosphate phosphodiesterase
LDEAIKLSKLIAAKKTYFTHFSHDLGLHEAIEKSLPENVYLAYDGLCLTVND